MIASLIKPTSAVTRLTGICCLFGVLMCASSAQDGAGTEVKKLSILIRGVDKELKTNIEGFLEIRALEDTDITSIPRLRFLHGRAEAQIAAALRPFGYYRPTIETELTDVGSKWTAIYRVNPNDKVPIVGEPLISLKDVLVDCQDFRYRSRDRKSLLPEIAVADDDFNKYKELVIDFCQARESANLKQGQPLDQQAYDKLKQSMQTSAARYGFFDAEFTQQQIRIDVENYTAEISLELNPGPRYRIGEAVITQDIDWISKDLLARYVELEDQDYFDAGKLQALQSDLTNSNYYKRVDVRASALEAVDEVIPVKVDLTHIKPREYVMGIGYGTDTRARIRVGVDGRRINRRGHHYKAEGQLSEIGYGVSAAYTIPTGDPRTDNYGIRIGIEREKAEREFKGLSLGGTYRFRDGFWLKTYAVDFNLEEFILDGESSLSRLLIPSVEWTRTYPAELERRINTINGTWLQLGLRGGSESLWSDTSFVQPQISTKIIKTFTNNHRFLVRASAATTWVDNYDKLPSSLRYYAGGDASVRGFEFQTIAPVNDENEPQGGRHLLEASAEYEVPFTESFSWAAFSDFGDAFDDNPEYRFGLGVGLRWQSPIGPVRVDVARKMNDPGEGNVRLHLSIGPDL